MENINPAQIHMPVLAGQLIESLNPVAGGLYLDGTLGLGGHAAAILQAADASRICGIDQDQAALDLARQRLASFGDRARLFHMRYGDFGKALESLGWDAIDGAILDIGVSSMQLDDPERGFSFRASGPLDMRMDQESGRQSAWHLVNRGSFAQLRDMFATLGEEPMAGRIARNIVDARQKKSLDDTMELAELVRASYPRAWRGKSRNHPATRVFQALRMEVNDELGQLRQFMASILPWLKDGGRLVVITFHSLEDRMVKHAMRDWARGCLWPSGECGERPLARVLYKKPLTAGEDEIEANPRAKSAKLRAIEKISG